MNNKKRTIREILERREIKPDSSKEALIGKIIGIHGLKGEVKIKPESEIFLRQIEKTKELTGYKGTSKKTLTIESIRKKDDIFIVKFEESTDRTYAENLLKTKLYVEKEKLVPLGENEFYFENLIGCKVITESGEIIGEIVSVMEMPASNILVVNNKDKETLIPFIKEFIKETDIKHKKILITPIEGLI